MAFIVPLLKLVVTLAWLLMVWRVGVSWFDPRLERSSSRRVYRITEPFLAPLREVLPSTGMIDFSPMVLMAVLLALMWVVQRL